MTKEEILKEDIFYFAQKKRPFFGRFWNSVDKIKDYQIIEKDGRMALVHCSGHGAYDWYYFDDYGKTWAFHLCQLPDDIIN